MKKLFYVFFLFSALGIAGIWIFTIKNANAYVTPPVCTSEVACDKYYNTEYDQGAISSCCTLFDAYTTGCKAKN